MFNTDYNLVAMVFIFLEQMSVVPVTILHHLKRANLYFWMGWIYYTIKRDYVRYFPLFFILFTAAVMLLNGCNLNKDKAENKRLALWVDPMIGTSGHGHTFPRATLSFGMVQLSPDME
jgi:cell division protein FtsW (lipid II flippase)